MNKNCEASSAHRTFWMPEPHDILGRPPLGGDTTSPHGFHSDRVARKLRPEADRTQSLGEPSAPAPPAVRVPRGRHRPPTMEVWQARHRDSSLGIHPKEAADTAREKQDGCPEPATNPSTWHLPPQRDGDVRGARTSGRPAAPWLNQTQERDPSAPHRGKDGRPRPRNLTLPKSRRDGQDRKSVV